MRAGELRHIIKVQYPVETQDTAGQPIPTWVTLFQAWAAVEPLSAREYILAQQTNSDINIKIRIRARPTSEPRVSAKMRVLFGTRTFEIVAPPIEIEERNREVQLLCREVF